MPLHMPLIYDQDKTNDEAKKILIESNSKLLVLEVIRFISAVAVLFWHYQHFSYVADKPTNFVSEKQPLYQIFGLLYDYGYYGVQVFWCISGFIFFWKYKDLIAGKFISSRKFFVLRFSRLYPLHLATLLVVAFLQLVYYSKINSYFVYQNNDYMHFILQLFMASNWGVERGSSFNGPIWSISLEVLVYIAFFLILRYIGKSIYICVFIVFFSMAAKYVNLPSPIFGALAFFYVGGLSAIVFENLKNTKYKTVLISIALFAAFVLPILAYVFQLYQSKYFQHVFLMVYTPVLLYLSTIDLAINGRVQKIIEATGNMTYSSYLIHFPLQLLIMIIFKYLNLTVPLYDLGFFILFMITTLIASYLVYRYFELPAQNYIRNKFN